MKNKEKYHDEIIRLALAGCELGLKGDRIVSCEDLCCSECGFSITKNGRRMKCREFIKLWLNEEYTEPKPKLTKRERDFIDCIAADFHLIREVDGSIALFTGGLVLELDEGLFSFITKVTSKKELLQMEVEDE